MRTVAVQYIIQKSKHQFTGIYIYIYCFKMIQQDFTIEKNYIRINQMMIINENGYGNAVGKE